MLKCMMYALISLLRLFLLVLRNFTDFDFVSQAVSKMRTFEALRIKEDSEIDPKTPNRAKQWPEPRSKEIQEKQQVKQGRASRVDGPHSIRSGATARGGPHRLTVVSPVPPSSLVFFVVVRVHASGSFADLILAKKKAIFVVSFICIPFHSP